MNKAELREQARLHLERLNQTDEDPEMAAELFARHVPLKDGQTVALYWPMKHEFDVRYIIDDLIRQGVSVALPVAGKSRKIMHFARWDGKTDLIAGDYGVYVPPVIEEVAPDIVVVPFLAFDRKGNRLGRGAGHYDATLESLRSRRKILAVGVGYAAQAVLFNLPAEPHDQRLDMVITPSGVHDFRL